MLALKPPSSHVRMESAYSSGPVYAFDIVIPTCYLKSSHWRIHNLITKIKIKILLKKSHNVLSL